jgi:hypothetical protein
MNSNKIFFALSLLMVFGSQYSRAEDLRQTVQGSEFESTLDSLEVSKDSPYLNASSNDVIKDSELDGDTSAVTGLKQPNLLENHKVGSEFNDIGYTVPGTFEKNDSYIDLDKSSYANRFSKEGSSSVSLSYIRDNFDYQSPNNIINRTIATGYKHVQSGFLFLRNDKFFLKTSVFHFHWSAGVGLAYNYGRGIFVTGEQSEAGFRLWEIPVDVGVGLNFNAGKYVKISATGGPSVLMMIQNRDDLTAHETGKNKLQTGFGYFASAQVKLNMYSFAGESAYELFTSNQITNCYFTLEARMHNYEKYLESIKVSGTSFGAGLTFEFL